MEATKKLDAAKAAAKAAGFTTEVPVSNDEEQLVAAAAAALLGAMTGKPELGKLEAAADAVATAAKATKTPPPDEFEVRTLSGEAMAALKEAFAGATGSKAAGAAAAKEAAKLVEVAATELGGTAPTGGAAAAGAAAAAERKKGAKEGGGGVEVVGGGVGGGGREGARAARRDRAGEDAEARLDHGPRRR